MTDVRFYGYKHWTLEDPPRCFNVGKGLKKRPWNAHLKRRNHKWYAISSRLGLRVEVCIGPVTNEEACAWEIEWIARENTFSTNHSHTDDADIGCNFTKGGEGTSGHKVINSPEARRKMSIAHKGKPTWNKGLTGAYSEETLQKMSVATKTRDKSVFEKISRARKGKPTWNKGTHGLYSEETRRKISEAASRTLKGRPVSEATRKKMSESAKRREERRKTLKEPTYESEDDPSTTAPVHPEGTRGQ